MRPRIRLIARGFKLIWVIRLVFFLLIGFGLPYLMSEFQGANYKTVMWPCMVAGAVGAFVFYGKSKHESEGDDDP